MHALFTLGLTLVTALPALAQWDKILTKKTRTLITCAEDSEIHYDFGDDNIAKSVIHGKISESIRTSWMKDGVEYRRSEYRSFRQNGTVVVSKGTNEAKVETLVNGNLVTERMSMESKDEYFDEKTGAFLRNQETERHSENTYRVEGNQRFLIRSTIEGKELPPSDAFETTTVVDAKTKNTRVVEKTPYSYEEDGAKVTVLKSIIDCSYEILD